MKLFLRSVVAMAIAIIAPTALGQNTIWNNTGSDESFETVSNWSNGIPGVGFSTYVFPGAHSDTTTPNTYFSGGSLNIIINASASHSTGRLIIENGFGSGVSSNGSVSMTFATGTTFTVGSNVDIAGTETFNFSGNLTLQTGSIDVGGTPIYQPGAGTMNFSNGTLDLSAVGTALNVGLVNTKSAFTQGSGTTASTVLLDQLNLGSGTSSGSYSITGTGANNVTLNANGTVQMDDSTFLQNDAASTVDLSAAGTATNLGTTSGATATYTLESGTLKINNGTLGAVAGAFGNLVQSGGSFISNNGFAIGALGTGTYTLSGTSTADFQGGFSLGDSVGSTLTQSGSSTLTSEGAVTIGTSGIGNYNLQGGTATFSDGLTVGATGTITQTGGTLIVTGGQTLDLSAAGSSYNLNGGTLQTGSGGLVGTTGQGTLNLSGGTLQITSAGAFTDALDSTLSGISTIDAATTPGVTAVTLSGNYSGTGGLTFLGNGGTTFTFGGTNTYTGPTTVTSGTLDTLAAQIAQSSALNIGPAGTLNLTLANGGFGYAGAITGTGALNVNFATAGDPFVITNSGNFTGPLTLGANGTRGTLQVYSGSFGNIGDNGTGSGVTIGGTPLVAIASATPTTGTVIFGANTYTGLTTINPNFTLLASGIGGNVTNNGTLGLAPGTAVGSTLNINGTLASTSATSVLSIRANGSTSTPVADLIQSTGAANISSTSTIFVSGTGNITTPIPVVTGGGGLNIAPGALPNVSTNSSLLFNATLSRVGNSLDITTVQTPVSSFAQTPNQSAVGGSIDNIINNPGLAGTAQQLGNFNTLLGALNQLNSGSQIGAALEQLTPESLQYARDIAFENSTFLAQRVNNVCSDLRAGYGGLDTSMINVVMPGFDSGMGRSLGSFFAYNDPSFHSAAPNGVNYYPGGESTSPAAINSSPETDTPTRSTAPWNSSHDVITDSPNPYLANSNPAGPETPRLSEFISGDVILADLNTNQNTANAPSSKASYTAGDATAGISFRMTSKLAAGVLFDYNHTEAKTDSNGSKTTVDSYSPGLFATYYDHGFYANGLFSFGYNDYNNKRSVAVLGDTASSSPNGQQYVGNLDFGYDFKPAKGWIAGPTLGMTYTHLDVDSFTETGAPGADLAVQSQSADSFRTRLGGHVGYSTNTGDVLLTPSFTAMWQHEFLDNSSGITSSFNDFNSNAFTIQTAAPSRDSALIGIGLSATLSNSMTLYINYLADVGATNYFAQSVVGGFKARF